MLPYICMPVSIIVFSGRTRGAASLSEPNIEGDDVIGLAAIT